MSRTSTELPRLEPESSASANSAIAAGHLILVGNNILVQFFVDQD